MTALSIGRSVMSMGRRGLTSWPTGVRQTGTRRLLRERYPDLSVEPGGARRMNHDSSRGNPLPIPPFRDPLSNGNIRTFESRDAWQTLGRLALNFHRTKEWTFAAIGASLSPCRDKGRLTHPGSCPAGDGATA